MEPKVSVISTVYNGAPYLEEYFSSLQQQTFKDYEVILIDDGSTDESGKICEEYAEKNPKILLYHQENQGVSAARNRALSYVNTDWITYIDCDDAVHPQYLELLYQGIQNNNVTISGIGVLETEFIPHSELHSVFPHWERYCVDSDFLLSDKCNRYFGQIACGKLIHKSILQSYPFTVGRIFEDNAVVKKWIYEAHNVAFNECPMYYYRINNAGLSKGALTAKKVFDVLWARDEIINFYKEKELQNAYKQAARDYILFGVSLYFKLNRVDRISAKRLKRQILERYNDYKTTIPFSKSDKRFVFELQHPHIMWFYWKIINAIKHYVKLRKKHLSKNG